MSQPSPSSGLQPQNNACVHCGLVFSPSKPKQLKDHLHLFHELSYSFTAKDVLFPWFPINHECNLILASLILGTAAPSSGINPGMVYTAQRKMAMDTLACIVPGCQLGAFSGLVKYKKHLTKSHAGFGFQLIQNQSGEDVTKPPETINPSHGPVRTSTPALGLSQLSQPYNLAYFDCNIDPILATSEQSLLSDMRPSVKESLAEPVKKVTTDLIIYQPVYRPAQLAEASHRFHPYRKTDAALAPPSALNSQLSSIPSDTSPPSSAPSSLPSDIFSLFATPSDIPSNTSADSVMTNSSFSISDSDPSIPALDSPRSCLIDTPALNRNGLVFHSHYHTVHCVNDACNIAVLPYAIVGHLRDQHRFHFTAKEQELLDQAIQELNPISSDSELALPPPGEAPVEALKVHPLGHCCRECCYAVPMLKTFQRHWRDNHRYDFPGTKANEGYYLAPIQSFYIVPARYFEVNPALTKLSKEAPFAIFLKTLSPILAEESHNILPPPDQVREVSPLLRTTGWHLHLKIISLTVEVLPHFLPLLLFHQ
ncbi:hypothetical protein EDD85DRAFT_946256 [Armillaria nabsnona]|nr:hypothetical protein EDD85DRAFT_946256 [Armillaria nabsnona]